jgi:hypothetical protein
MVPEAPLECTEHGLVPEGDGWFVLNARDACWRPGEGRGAYCIFEDWGGYTVDRAAIRHGAGVEQETPDAAEAYARFPDREPGRYREGWLPS